MSKGLHVGCLCVIVGGDIPENIGRHATVVDFDDQSFPADQCWEIEAEGAPFKAYLLGGGFGSSCKLWAMAEHLLPITPDESITQETDREVVV